MSTKVNPPSFHKSKSYELYKQELLAWAEITDLAKGKRGIAIALTLPEDHETRIREKVFDQIDLVDLKKDDGFYILLEFLDKHLAKDDLTDSLEKFEEFEDFSRTEGQSINEYVAEFDSRYRKIEKKKMKLPPEILAFKLLRKANIAKDEKMLVLTGMNYENKATLFEEAKRSLKKFKGERGNSGMKETGASIKLEPAFLADNEEALWAAGYVKRDSGSGYQGYTGYQRGSGRLRRGNVRAYGQTSQRGIKNLNSLGLDGKPITCRSCGSYRHLVSKCPDSYENLSKVNITENEEEVVLFTGSLKEEIQQLGVDARNCAVLDSACSSTVCGRAWMSNYMDSLTKNDQKKIVKRDGHKIFKFGGGTKLKSRGEYEIPVCIVGKDLKMKTDVVDSDIPLLLSRSAMKQAGVKMDLENDTAVILGKEVSLNLTTSGHYCIPIDKTETICVTQVYSVKLEEMTDEKRKSTLLKLHRQFAHPPRQKLVALLKDAAIWNSDYEQDLAEIDASCELCKVYARTPPRPSVAMPMAKEFNEKVSMDLKSYKGKLILHMIDMWSRYTVSVFIERKKPSCVIDAMIKNWVGMFGVMGAIFTDNGGEFSSDEMREVASILNVRVCTTAGMSPFQNGLCLRVHAVTDSMLVKLEADQKNIDLKTRLAWANMARNSLQMWSGYSSHQLVFGKNPLLPNALKEELPAMEGNTTSETFAKHLNALHATRKAYIESEASERVRRALRTKVRAAEEVFEKGDTVFYKRDGKERWLGPGKVVFQDGKVVFVRHGGIFVRVSPNRLCKTNTEIEQQSHEVKDANDNQCRESVTPVVSETIPNVTEEINLPGVNVNNTKNMPHHIRENTQIQYKLPGSDQWVKAVVLGRAGKSTGKYRMWYNVQDVDNNEKKSINIEDVEFEIQRENNSDDNEDVLSVNFSDTDTMGAKSEELQKLYDFGTYEEIEDNGQTTVSTRWVITSKEGKTRARLVARGFEEWSFIQSDSPTVGKGAIRVFLTVASSKKWIIKTTDIKSAFLQGKLLERNVYVKPPKESITRPGLIWKLKHGLYGLKDGARQFYLSIKEELTTLGCTQSKLDPAVFTLIEGGQLMGMICSHVDDFLHAENKDFEGIMEKLRQRFIAGKVEERDFDYIGFRITQNEKSVQLDHTKFMEKLPNSHIDPKRASMKEEQLTSEEQTQFRRIVGQLNWAVQGSRPDLAFELIDLSTKLKGAKVLDLIQAIQLFGKLKSIRVVQKFPSLVGLIDKDWEIIVFCDAALCNLNNGTGSTGGHIVWLKDRLGNCCPISWQANKFKRVVRSTIAAETLSLEEGLETAIYFRSMIEHIFGVKQNTIPITEFIDNRSVTEALYLTRLVDDKRLRIDIASVTEMKEKNSVHVRWISGKLQLANSLTKRGASGVELLTVLQTGKMIEEIG